MDEAKIVTLTLNPAIDGFCEAEVVRPIHKIRTHREEFHPGGGGINAARVIRDLGGDVCALYLAGGATGQVLDELIDQIGLRRRRIPIADHTRMSQVVLETSSGLEYRFVPEGPRIAPAEWEACKDAVASLRCDWLVMSGSVPPGLPETAYADLLDIAVPRGIRCALDTSGEPLRRAVARGGLALVKPSLGEFEALIGRKLPDFEAVGREARAFVETGQAEIVAVTLGRDGAILASAAGVERRQAAPVTGRSAVGAGDSFVGAMVVALARGRDASDAFRFGMAAGSAAVLRHGPYLCDPSDVARLYDETT